MTATRSQRFTFPGTGGHPLAARLDLPAADPVATALVAHCFTCSQDSVAAARIAHALVAAGLGVLRFDFTGLGGSGGDFAETDFSSNVEDLLAASSALAERSPGPQVLVGHSLGGTAALVAAGRLPAVVAVVTINAPADPAHVTRHFPPEAVATLAAGGEEAVAVDIGGRPFRIGRRFLADVSDQRVDEAVAALDRPLLVLHAPTDAVVGVEHARRIFDAARHPKSFVALDGADHLLSGKGDGAWAGSLVAGWVRRYLPDPVPAPAPAAAAPGPPGGTVRVTELSPDRLQQRVEVGRHTFVADEPPEQGDDAGPAPYDLLLAALGTCTTITVRLYADRKGWPLTGVGVDLRHRREHDPAGGPTVEHVEGELHLDGRLTPEQRERLAQIAQRCPVHRTLEAEKRIAIELAPPPPPG